MKTILQTKQLLLFTILLFFSIFTFGQEKYVTFIENNKTKNDFKQISNSTTSKSFCYIDKNLISILDVSNQVINIYSIRGVLIKTLSLNYYAIDFDYKNGNFYLLGTNYIFSINSDGKLIEKINFIKPKGTPFSIEKIHRLYNKTIIYVSDGSSWEVLEKKLVQINSKHWIFDNNIMSFSKIINKKTFEYNIINSQVQNLFEINLNTILKNNEELGTSKIVYSNENYTYFDVEISNFDEKVVPKRFIIKIDNYLGTITNKIEIPFIYYKYIKNPFAFNDGNNELAYLMETPAGLYIFPLSNDIKIPINCSKKYHYNLQEKSENTEANIELNNNIDTNKIVLSGNNCVTRTQVFDNAVKYRDLEWTASSSNLLLNCTLVAGKWARTPSWISIGSNTSVPYKWGGYTDWTTFETLATQGKKTGNRAIWYNGSNYLCGGTSGDVHSYDSDTDIIGVDCSGFVSRCWETSHHTTSTLPNISTLIGNANNSTNFSQLQPGDIINKSGSHVRICLSQNPNGTGNFMEAYAGSQDWKVGDNSYNLTSLSGYVCYKYNNINDSRLRLSQEISLNPTNIIQGGAMNVTYQIGNYGTESWTGTVRLIIIQSNGNEVAIQTSGQITIGPNQTSSLFSFNTASVSSPLGLTKLEVRVANPLSCNFSRYYPVGAGGFSNPVEFNINAGSTCNPATVSLNTPTNYQNFTLGQQVPLSWTGVQNGCSISEYKLYLQNPSGTSAELSMGTSSSYNINTTSSSNPGTYRWGIKAKNSQGVWGNYTYRYFVLDSLIDYYSVSIVENPTIGGTTSGDGTYPNGSQITAIATPEIGYIFSNWTENGIQVSTNASYSFSISTNRNLVANFLQNTINYTISTTSNPTIGGTTSGDGTFNNGDSCYITATPNTDYTFTNWTENGTLFSTNQNLTFTVTGNKNLVANFSQNQTGTCLTCPNYDFSTSINSSWSTHSSSILSNGCKIYRFLAVPGNTYTFKTGCEDGASTSFDSVLDLLDVNCAMLSSNDDYCPPTSKIIWTCNYTSTNWVYLKVKGYQTAFGNYTLAYTSTPTLSINETDNVKNIIIYPNPTKEILNIETDNDVINNISIIDNLGRIVKSEKVNLSKYQLNIQDLSNAIYLIVINTDKGIKTVKIIKQ